MTFQGEAIGMVSILLGVLFFVYLAFAIFSPGGSMSTGAVMVGVGTVIATIFVAVALLAHK
ncbi:MAG: hypothetical protein ACYC7D_02420 [Nitrososphaerales archaeon]